MKVITRIVIDIVSGKVLEEESFDYTGPVAWCGGGGGGGGGGDGGDGFGDGYGDSGPGGDAGFGTGDGYGDSGPGGDTGDGWGWSDSASPGSAQGGYGSESDEGFDDSAPGPGDFSDEGYQADSYEGWEGPPGYQAESDQGWQGPDAIANPNSYVGLNPGLMAPGTFPDSPAEPYGHTLSSWGQFGKGLTGAVTSAITSGMGVPGLGSMVGALSDDAWSSYAADPAAFYSDEASVAATTSGQGTPGGEGFPGGEGAYTTEPPRLVADIPRSAEVPIEPPAPYSVPYQPVAPEPMIPEPVKKRTLDLKRASALTGNRVIPNPSQAYALTGRRA